MEVILSQLIASDNNARTAKTVTKTINSDFVPRVGDFITDSAFKDPYEYEVVSVIVDLERKTAHVGLALLELKNADEAWIDKNVEIYILHDWESFGFPSRK